MTKQYKIIFLNDYLYVIDEEADVNDGDWCIHFGKGYTNKVLHDQNTLVKITEKQLCGKNGGHGWFWKQWDKNPQFDYSHNELKKIIASNDPSLNIPVLPYIEDLDLKDEIARAIGSNVSNTTLQEEKDATEACLAILKTKKYSEEELYERIVYWFSRGILAGKQNRVKELFPNEEKILQSLSPIPKAVKLEIIPSENYQKGAICSPWELKLTNNNEVIVKQWIYES